MKSRGLPGRRSWRVLALDASAAGGSPGRATVADECCRAPTAEAGES